MPGFFGKQATRLMRGFGAVQELADELFAMFGSDTPMETDQQVIMVRDNDEPIIRIIDRGGAGGDPIQITRDGKTYQNYSSYFNNTTNNNTPDAKRSHPPLMSGCIPGRITGGQGYRYSVSIYEDGPSSPATGIVSAEQLQIDPEFSIPSGSWVLVGFSERPASGLTRADYANGDAPPDATPSKVYYIQEPVWRPAPD